jgi:DNA primase
VIHNLERSILEILLLYGNNEVEFENSFIKFDENQKEIEIIEKVTTKVFQRIYLNLQEDEVEFSHPVFKEIYDDLVAQYLTNEVFDNNTYSNTIKPEFSQIVSDILMDDEKYQLHGWLDKKQVFVKDKKNEEVLQRLVTESIMTYREYLINKLNQDLVQNALSKPDTNIVEVMETINEYNKLKVSITRSIGRMRSN